MQGILAAQIIGASDDKVQQRLVDYKKDLSAGVAKKYKKLEACGV